jgi:glucan-binding YG repeat protein
MKLKRMIKSGILITLYTIVITSAAALTAHGEGWSNITGVWQWVKDDGTIATDTWKSANGYWFYLDSHGNITKNQMIIEETSNGVEYYFVDSNGALLRDSWKAIAIDQSEKKNYKAQYWLYYFGNDGKAYKSGESFTEEDIKTIDGKKYAFDRNGRMLYGWIDASDVKQQDNDALAWIYSDYYFGSWNDGHIQEGWIQLPVYERKDGATREYWFYLDSYGKKIKNKRKIIDDYYYYFEDDGHMSGSWPPEKE